MSFKDNFYKKYLMFFVFGSFSSKIIPNTFNGIFVERNEFDYFIKNENFLEFFKFIKMSTWFQLTSLSDIIGVDYPGRSLRFSIIYHILSIHYNFRTNIVFFLDELFFVPTISFIYKAANWYEREVWDLFGIFFKDHLDLRRILTDYSFDGHPLRKDFPVTGYFEAFYDDTKKRLLNVSVSLFQDFRFFTFNNP